MNVLTMILDRF